MKCFLENGNLTFFFPYVSSSSLIFLLLPLLLSLSYPSLHIPRSLCALTRLPEKILSTPFSTTLSIASSLIEGSTAQELMSVGGKGDATETAYTFYHPSFSFLFFTIKPFA